MKPGTLQLESDTQSAPMAARPLESDTRSAPMAARPSESDTQSARAPMESTDRFIQLIPWPLQEQIPSYLISAKINERKKAWLE